MKTNIYFWSYLSSSQTGNVPGKRCREKQTTFYVNNFFPPKIEPFMRLKKCGRAGQATGDNIRRMRLACWITKDKNTLRICYTYCFSTATTVARTRLNVTLYVHCMYCLILRMCTNINIAPENLLHGYADTWTWFEFDIFHSAVITCPSIVLTAVPFEP